MNRYGHDGRSDRDVGPIGIHKDIRNSQGGSGLQAFQLFHQELKPWFHFVLFASCSDNCVHEISVKSSKARSYFTLCYIVKDLKTRAALSLVEGLCPLGRAFAAEWGMRFCLLICLGLALLSRLSHGKKERDQAWAFCSSLWVSARKPREKELRGFLRPSVRGRWELSSPSWVVGAEENTFSGRVFLEGALVEKSADLGRRVSVSGPFRCQHPFRNPGQQEDGLWTLRQPRLSARAGEFSLRFLEVPPPLWERFAFFFQKELNSHFQKTPSLLVLVRAVWLGDLSGFEEPLLRFYREGGLLAVLALSGQHVAVLVFLVTSGLAFFVSLLNTVWKPSWRYLGPVYPHVLRLIPLLSAGLLLLTSQGAASMKRTAAMALAYFVLRLRRFQCDPLQLTASSVACFLLWEPEAISTLR